MGQPAQQWTDAPPTAHHHHPHPTHPILFAPEIPALLLPSSGEFAKIVTEALGHSAAASAQDAKQEVMPGMQREVARRFGQRVQRSTARIDDGDVTHQPSS